jgi:hypothetical protein
MLLGKKPFSAEARHVRPSLVGLLLLDILFLVASLLFGQAHPPLTTPHFELYQPHDWRKPPMGVLGLLRTKPQVYFNFKVFHS